jgi:hypothetical protein
VNSLEKAKEIILESEKPNTEVEKLKNIKLI